MHYRTLGSLQVSLLGLGTSRLASMGSGHSRADAARLLSVARDVGINVVDTSDTYGSGGAERWIGELTASDADRWVVVSKTGLPFADLHRPFRILNQPAKKVKQRIAPGFRLDARRLRKNLDGSLQRLKRDRIELYLLHLPSVEVLNDEEIVAALHEARSAGKIAEFGVSSDDMSVIRSFQIAWGISCAETSASEFGDVHQHSAERNDLELIVNRATTVESLASLRSRNQISARDEYRLLLRHAAALPSVRVVLSGTASADHLRQNAAALDGPITAADLLH